MLYGTSVGVLVIYSFIVYWYEDDSKYGFIIMIAILVNDVALYFFFLGKIVRSALYLIVTAIISRFFLIIFGMDNWIYGYMIIYLFYALNLVVVIGRKRYPFEEDYENINLNSIIKKKQRAIDVSRIPEVLYVLVNIVFASVIGLLVLTSPTGVPLVSL